MSSALVTCVLKEFAFLKSAENLEAVFARGCNLPQTGGLAVPAGRAHQGAELSGHLATGVDFATYLIEPAQVLFLVYSRSGIVKGTVALRLSDERIELGHFAGDCSGGEISEAVRELVRWCQQTLWSGPCVANHDELIKFFGDDLSGVPVAESASERSRGFVILKYNARWRGGNATILTAGPSVSAREVAYTLDAAKYGWNSQWAKYLKAFEAKFANYVGVRYALATSSCTGALHLALLALDIGPGDEVIVPDITWVATGNAVLYVGATPVFADVDQQSWCLDPDSLRACITPRTKAIIPVHLYGHPCEMDKILEIAHENNLFVVEDAAPSIGAEYRGRRTGSFGHFAAFSFQGAKLAVTGEGGMLLTDDEQLYKKVYTIWDQGRLPGTFWIANRGWKYKMANMLAAFGLGQLERNDEMVEAKRRIFSWYDAGLNGLADVSLHREAKATRSIYWMTSLLLHEKAPIERDMLMAKLKDRKIDTRPVFPAISQYPIWPVKHPPQPNAHRIGQRAINLPSGVCLSWEEVNYVCDSIREIIQTA